MNPLVRLPIFRSPEQAAILIVLLVRAVEPLSLTEIARQAGVSLSVTHKEIEQLEGAGLVRSQRRGRARLVEANEDSPLIGDFRDLLTKAFGPTGEIEAAIGNLDGIDEAFIFGSWAESEHGFPTGGSNDIDLMIIGAPDLDDLYARIRDVEDRIGLPVNVTLRTPREWESDDSGFARRVRERPTIAVS